MAMGWNSCWVLFLKNVCMGDQLNLFGFFFVLFFPAISFASVDEWYVQSFAEHFKSERFNESLQVLDDWERSDPANSGRISGMKASVYLAMGDLRTSEELMTKCIQNLESEMTSNPSLEYMIKLYYKVLRSGPGDQVMPSGLAMTCKHHDHEQPIGVKVKYWFGVGQILAGIIAAPFSGGTSAALILSGSAMVVDASCDALNNKEMWERELNQRQKHGYEYQRNSFLIPSMPKRNKLIAI